MPLRLVTAFLYVFTLTYAFLTTLIAESGHVKAHIPHAIQSSGFGSTQGV